MQVLFKITRQQRQGEARVQTYELNVDPSTTILDCLNQIKWQQDGSLAFRKNCRNTICGSCGMRINHRAALACQQNVQAELEHAHYFEESSKTASTNDEPNGIPVIHIAPMGNFPIIKDLVVEMDQFWQNLEKVEPYVSSASRQLSARESLQSPADRSKLDQMGNCILCGACYSDCNALATNTTFVGPHALAKGYRLLADTRDQKADRIEQYNQDIQGVWGCTRCFNCNTVCPMGVAPLDQISRIKSKILNSSALPASRPRRHRQVLIELVQQGGWIDERKFGVQVVGNNFKDIPGLLSLIPLAQRMLRSGKLPMTFEPSAGTAEVRSLMNSVKMQKSIQAVAMSSSSPDVPDANSTPQPELEAPPEPAFGWTDYAERINGRFAMLGFVVLLLLELFTRQDFFTWVGLR